MKNNYEIGEEVYFTHALDVGEGTIVALPAYNNHSDRMLIRVSKPANICQEAGRTYSFHSCSIYPKLYPVEEALPVFPSNKLLSEITDETVLLKPSWRNLWGLI